MRHTSTVMSDEQGAGTAEHDVPYVSAGFPSPAEGRGISRLSLDALVIEDPSATFFVRMKGDALMDEGIFDGDVLVVDRSKEPSAGALVVVHGEGGFRARRTSRRALASLSLDDIHESTGDGSLVFWGMVTYVLHKV